MALLISVAYPAQFDRQIRSESIHGCSTCFDSRDPQARCDTDGATLPILHAVQEALRHVPEIAVPIIAEALNLSRTEIHGVLTFYQVIGGSIPALSHQQNQYVKISPLA